jgi:hypothetical protein
MMTPLVKWQQNQFGTEAENRLLSAVPPALRTRVRAALIDPRLGGRGLRAWLALSEVDERPLPKMLPDCLISIYLSDTEAEPLYDCEECGLPVPVRAGRRGGHEPSCDRVYFPQCPNCGGRTGPHAFWSRLEHDEI